MRVEQLWRYPVKSMQGERCDSIDVGALGMIGDRQWAVVDTTTGATLTGRREPRLLWASAALTDDNTVEIVLPTGERASSSAELSAWLGRPVELRRPNGTPGTYEIAADFEQEDSSEWLTWEGPGQTFHDSTRTQISIGSADEIGDWDPRRFRFNVVVSGGSTRPLVGSQLDVGSASLDVVKHIDRCVMTTRAQPGGVERDLGVLKTIIAELDNELGVGAMVIRDGCLTVGDELRTQR